MINIQSATRDDQQQIKRLINQILVEYKLPPDPNGVDYDLDHIEEQYNNNYGYFGVLKFDEEVVATLGIYRINAITCELRKMYMAAEFRGRGIGNGLLEFAMNKARSLGYQHMILETASSLVEAINLYKKFGFNEIFPDHLAERCDRAYEIYL